MILKETICFKTLRLSKAAGLISASCVALSLAFGSTLSASDVAAAPESKQEANVMSYRLNSLSKSKAEPPPEKIRKETGEKVSTRVPKLSKKKSFEVSGKVSSKDTPSDLDTISSSASRTPVEPKVQTLRLSSRSTGIQFRAAKKQPVAETTPTQMSNESSENKRSAKLRAPGFANFLKAKENRLDKPSKVDHSPFRVEKTEHNDHGDSHHGHSLELSDDVVPFTEYGTELTKRQKTLTEVIEDKHYPENIERLEKIAERSADDVDMELPERKNIFGNDRFMSPGPLHPGIVMPSGATWRPSFMLFGDLRTGLQSYEAAGGGRINEWANRLDIYGNLALTSTERLLIGFRPLDEDGIYTGVAGGQGLQDDGFQNGLDLEPHTFFFEGYFDELFPFLDPNDFKGNDYGFSFGRQPFSLQAGIMADDNIDALAITKHNMFLLGSSNARVSAWFGFNEINRGDNLRDSNARLFALDAALDYPKNTIEADIVYVDGSSSHGGDGLYFGLGHIAQLGYWNSTFRVNRSFALNRKTEAIDDGWLLTHQFGRAMRQSEDILTLSSFAEFGNYTSVARGPESGGSLGGFSLLHRAVGLGYYGSALSEETGDQAGQIISYQHYLDEDAQKQILYAAGFKIGLDDHTGADFTGALGLQYQQHISKNTIWSIGGFGTITDEGDKGLGIRTELRRKF